MIDYTGKNFASKNTGNRVDKYLKNGSNNNGKDKCLRNVTNKLAKQAANNKWDYVNMLKEIYLNNQEKDTNALINPYQQ